MATLMTLVSFDGTDDGAYPQGSLIIDSSGDLYGTTYLGGADGEGTVFEIVATPTGYSSTPTTLVSFNNTDGADLQGSLIVDSSGDLYGTTANGGASGDGSVFEITDTLRGGGYSNTPTTLASFNNAGDGETPQGSLIADSAGNLYGTASYGGAPNYDGTVFEIAKTATGYNSTPIVLAAFNGTDGSHPSSSLIVDTSGNFYGTTPTGGAGYGTVFEVAKTAMGYNSTPIALVSFNGTDGANPDGSLIADASGNLYGTTASGGADDDGTVFEIAKTAMGYNSAPIVLASFDGTDGEGPSGSLLMDAAGNLFGTTDYGGLNNGGTVFELANTESGYSNTPTTLVSFDDTDGALPTGSLIADAAGNLYGTTDEGGAYDDQGTVFEITDSGFVVCFGAGTRIRTTDGDRPVETLAVGDLVVTASGEPRPIKWLGHRRIDCRRHPQPNEAQPIRIAAHAFGENRPARDLFLSPGHAICIDLSGEALIPAQSLANGTTVAQLDVDEVTYWHVELDSHDILLAENLACESYIDMGNRGFFVEGDAVALNGLPDAPERTHADFCRPFHDRGAIVERAKAMLRQQAESLGYRLTTSADAHLIADGKRVEPMWLNDTRLAFVLPAGVEDVKLCSRTFVPAHTCADTDDRRTLGLCLSRLQINGTEIALDDEKVLGHGWHNPEGGPCAAWRWSNGVSSLPIRARLIVIDLAGPGHYWAVLHDDDAKVAA